MITEEAKDFLEHYGVKGMRWGVRRSKQQLQDNRQNRQAARPQSKARKMSDAELKTRVERLRLEREYVKITKELEPPPMVTSLLAKHGGQALSIVVGTTVSTIVGMVLKKKFNKDGKD